MYVCMYVYTYIYIYIYIYIYTLYHNTPRRGARPRAARCLGVDFIRAFKVNVRMCPVR